VLTLNTDKRLNTLRREDQKFIFTANAKNGTLQKVLTTFKHIVVTVQLLLAQSADQWEHLNQQQAALGRTDWLYWEDRLVTLGRTDWLH